ncbi:hypothetical protein [Mycobacterium sp. MS1601]|uniref:hypothetical protein n=1 Tax=Mycobacterium sp. MS1601 TaxID=1936029 RepID=UPI0012FBE145|nr:hypothetical protein [Mycobacterium sp. MS1601]
MGALAQAYRQEGRTGIAQALGELAEDSRTLAGMLQVSGDTTVRVPVATLTRIADHLTVGAQRETGSEALQAALWRTAGRLQRWIADATTQAAAQAKKAKKAEKAAAGR